MDIKSLPTLLELIERVKNDTLAVDQLVFYYQTKAGKENFIHRDELKKEAALASIYGHYQDRAIHIKTGDDDTTV
jgi:hypothetical protein